MALGEEIHEVTSGLILSFPPSCPTGLNRLSVTVFGYGRDLK